ncbi:MAG: TolC family protein [Bacteroidales bacterium]|nr:TolC family protein [Bacteroidales bacterium]
MKKTGLALLVFIIGFSNLQAQEEKNWSLRECIDYALENNINVKQYELNIDRAEEDVLQSKLDMLPTLNGYASHGYAWGQTVDRFTNQFATERTRSNNFYASTQLTVFNGFQKMNTMKRDQLALKATKYDFDKYMDDISLQIATAYLNILFYKEMLDIRKNQLETTEMQVDRMQKLVDAGTLAQGDLLNIESQAAAEEYQVIQARNSLDLAYLDLVQLLDLPSADDFEVSIPEVELPADPTLQINPTEVFKIARENQPHVKSAKLRVDEAEKTYFIAKGDQSPALSLSGSWGTGYSSARQKIVGQEPVQIQIGVTDEGVPVYATQPQYEYDTKPFGEQFNDNINKSLNLELSIPVFNGWRTRSSISKAQIAVEQAEYELELTKLQLNKTINQAHADAKAALNSYRSSRKKVSATREAFKYAEQKFNVGVINSVEYNEAKKDFTNAKSELLQAKYDYVFKSKVLDFYLGKPLSLD